MCVYMNARTAEQDDYTRLADLQDSSNVPEEGAYLGADVPQRCNSDKAPSAGTWGGKLLELCQSTELLIVNGRTPGDPDMRVICDAQYCDLSCDMPHDSEKSDHFPLQLDRSCSMSTPSADARSTLSQSSTCLQFKYVDSQADAYQQCLTAELLMYLVPLLTGAIDVSNMVAILITCMVQAAQQTLPGLHLHTQ